MPILFGYRAHRHFGLGWNETRSGKLMQGDPGYAMRQYHIKMEAERTPELESLITNAQDQGWSLHEIVEAIEVDKDGTVALIRRRKAALDGADRQA
jgi:hypothetical protein